MSNTTNKDKMFHIVRPGYDYNFTAKTTRAAIADAIMSGRQCPTKLYRVLDDDEEYLLFDSSKCQNMSINQILAWAEKGGRP